MNPKRTGANRDGGRDRKFNERTKGRMNMSKYEELKEAVRTARRKCEFQASKEGVTDKQYQGFCDDLADAKQNAQHFERAAASLIERAREAIRETCRLCPLATHGCNRCERSDDCEAKKLLAEMEAL